MKKSGTRHCRHYCLTKAPGFRWNSYAQYTVAQTELGFDVLASTVLICRHDQVEHLRESALDWSTILDVIVVYTSVTLTF